MKDWTVNEILTEPDLEAEFDRIYNNALALISPLTGNLDFGASRAIGLSLGSAINPSVQPTGDTNTGVYFSAADTVDIATGGVRAANFGASFLLAAAPEDARTNTVDVVGILRSTTSGIAAVGIGTGLQFDAENAAGTLSTFGRLDFVGTNVTAGSEATVMDILLRTAGAAEAARYRLQATGVFLGTLTHAITANRTWTLPNTDGTISLSAILDKVTTDITVSNTLVETQIYGKTITGGTLTTNNALRLTILGTYRMDAGVARTLTVRAKYGATTFATIVRTTDTLGTTVRHVIMDIYLMGDGATNAQLGKIKGSIGLDDVSLTFQGGGTAAEDSTTNKDLVVTVQHSVASATITFVLEGAVLGEFV